MDVAQPESVMRAFDAAALHFGALEPYLWQPIADATVRKSAPQPGEKVLDACCGTGASALLAAHQVGGSGWVDAVDISAPMIDHLRDRAEGVPQLRAHQGDVTVWAGHGYDVVQCVLGVFFFPDMDSGTEWLISRARDGGRVALVIWRQGAMEAAGRYLAEAVADVTGAPPPEPRKPHPVDAISRPVSYAAWLSARGLRDVEVIVYQRHLDLTAELAWLVITGSGFRGMLNALDPAQIDAARREYLRRLHRDEVTTLDATFLVGTGIHAP